LIKNFESERAKYSEKIEELARYLVFSEEKN